MLTALGTLALLAAGPTACSKSDASDAPAKPVAQHRSNSSSGVLNEHIDGVYAGYDEHGFPVYIQIFSADSRDKARTILAIYKDQLDAIDNFDPATILDAYPDPAAPATDHAEPQAPATEPAPADPAAIDTDGAMTAAARVPTTSAAGTRLPAILFRLDLSSPEPRVAAPQLLVRTGSVGHIWQHDEAFKRGPIDPMCEQLSIVGRGDEPAYTKIWYGPFLRPDGIDSRAIYTYFGPGNAASVLGLTTRETLLEVIEKGIQRDEKGNIRICTSECLCCQ